MLRERARSIGSPNPLDLETPTLLALTAQFFAQKIKAIKSIKLPLLAAVMWCGTSLKAQSLDKDWHVESQLQFHSLARSGAVLFGPGLYYGQRHQLGFKTLLSVGASGAYMAGLSYRKFWEPDAKTSVFVEPSASYNIIQFDRSVYSMGVAVGILHALSDQLSMGGNAGFEFFGNVGPLDGYAKISSEIFFTPKASLLMAVSF